MRFLRLRDTGDLVGRARDCGEGTSRRIFEKAISSGLNEFDMTTLDSICRKLFKTAVKRRYPRFPPNCQTEQVCIGGLTMAANVWD
jgi:hypothetical protein